MVTLTLTPEQVQDVVRSSPDAENSAKAYAALQRRTNARVERVKQAAKSWKVRYSETRRALLAAQAQIQELKRKLRNREFE